MKKCIILIFVLFLPLAIFAENVKEIEAYKLMLENQNLLKDSYNKGDYDQALEYAKNIRTYAKEVLAYLDEMNAKPEPVAVIDTEKTHVVLKGDSFWRIAAMPEYFGNPYKWPIIYKSNKNVLVDPDNPDLIHPGMIFKFTVPMEGE